MNQAIFIVDANHANASCIEAVKRLREVCDRSRLVVIGNSPQVDRWEPLIKYDGDEIHAPKKLRQGATLALFGLVAGDLLHDEELASWGWWLIGNLRALDEVAARAKERGIDAESYESLTPDEVQSIVDKRGSYSQSLRELFVELHAQNGRGPVHVGRFAEEAIHRWPELRNHDLRTALFGGKKFSKVADEIGLVRKRYELIKLANPDSIPAGLDVHRSCG